MKINRFVNGFIENFERECFVIEPNQYTVKYRLPPGSKDGLKIDLPKIKEHSNFLKSPSPTIKPPKDCDSILLDLEKKTFYLIEIKSLAETCKFENVKLQLTAGLEWLKFICFCLEINIDDYKIMKIYTIANSRAGYNEIKETDNIYRTYGKNIFLNFGL